MGKILTLKCECPIKETHFQHNRNMAVESHHHETQPVDFFHSEVGEPHATRRKQILKEFPEVAQLQGYDPNTKYQVLFWMISQFTLAYFLKDQSWPVLLLVGYIYGGVAGHALFLAMHEISRKTIFFSL
jgi:sphingolipid 4-desaturase/C4-monooxygenase